MPSLRQHEMENALRRMATSSGWFMPVLDAVSQLGLASWCVGAGALRNLVWDALHGYATPSHLADVDVAYFDASDLRSERDDQLQRRLHAALPGTPWEVTNQAAVHQWFEGHFGYAVEPLRSLEEAVGSWPEYATSVGLTLDAEGTVRVIAPHGLDDLFDCVVRRNPARVSLEGYRRRVEQKQYPARWPNVRVIDGCDERAPTADSASPQAK